VIAVWVEIVCFECANVITGRWSYERSIPRKELAKSAKLLGAHLKDKEHYCSTCYRRSLREKATP